MTTSMIEKVAMVIALDDFDGDENVWFALSEDMRGIYRRNARAALGTIHDLPQHLEEQGLAFSRDFHKEFPLAIDAALNEEMSE